MNNDILVNNNDEINDVGETLIGWVKKVREIKSKRKAGSLQNEKSPGPSSNNPLSFVNSNKQNLERK
jgi:hypothetical protein